MTSPIEPGAVLFELTDGAYERRDVVDVIATDRRPKALLDTTDGRIAVDALELEARMLDVDDPSWISSLYEGGDEWIPHPHRADVDADVELLERFAAPKTPADLTFEQLAGTGAQSVANDFLEGGGSVDGLVFHELGGIDSWKTGFVARNERGQIVSCVTLHHYHPSTNGVEIAITRVGSHEAAPANTSSWLIARVRKWAERYGYERLATYAGVGGNSGVCYRAAGFEPVGEPVEVDGKDWKGEKPGKWLKQKYVYELEPEKYSDKSEQWALESIADGVITPGRSAYSSTSARSVIAD